MFSVKCELKFEDKYYLYNQSDKRTVLASKADFDKVKNLAETFGYVIVPERDPDTNDIMEIWGYKYNEDGFSTSHEVLIGYIVTVSYYAPVE